MILPDARPLLELFRRDDHAGIVAQLREIGRDFLTATAANQLVPELPTLGDRHALGVPGLDPCEPEDDLGAVRQGRITPGGFTNYSTLNNDNFLPVDEEQNS